MGVTPHKVIIQNIKTVLDEIKPMIQQDGGDISFVDFKDGVVTVQFQGACVGCPIAIYTLKYGIEQALLEKVPEVKEVISVDEDEKE